MLKSTPTPIAARLDSLEKHLERENPTLLEVVRSYRELDKVARAMGIVSEHDSVATRVPWWPMVSVLGTFSAGKSTFINSYLGTRLQTSGNQAVDDKFTVICHAADGVARVLPGLALDADPRFPFYQISNQIEEVSTGEGSRVDAYLQLKTCGSERLRGKIVIDSPGFDADAQRTSILRITDHIIHLSDLVLVLFDARHPEPGAMQDTLQHLVAATINRPDSNKFLFILNQIDSTAREDNPEEVFAAWQRGMSQAGLTAGRFYRIYDKEASIPIENERLRARFEAKRDADLAEIYDRMEQVEVERAYRVVGVLEKLARRIENDVVPRVREARERIRRRVLRADALAFALVAALFLAWTVNMEYWQGLSFAPPWLGATSDPLFAGALLAALAVLGGYLHFWIRRFTVRMELRRLRAQASDETGEWVVAATRQSTGSWHSVLFTGVAGWGPLARRRLARVLQDADRFVQKLNDRYTSPSGQGSVIAAPPGPAPEEAAPDATVTDQPAAEVDGTPPAAVRHG